MPSHTHICSNFQKVSLGHLRGAVRAYYRNLAASDIGQKALFFVKKGTKNFTPPPLNSVPFLCALHENKALHNLHEWGQRATARCIEDLD